MRPPLKQHMVGVAGLAQETGLYASHVTQLLQHGMTVEEVRERAKVVRQKRAAKRRKEREVNGEINGEINGEVNLKVNLEGDRIDRSPAGMYVPRRGVLSAPSLPGVPGVPGVPSVRAANGTANGTTSYDAAVAGQLGRQIERETLNQAQLRRSIGLANQIEISNAKATGELISRDYVRSWGLNFLSRAVDILNQIPGILQDRMASEDDPVACGEMLRAEIGRAIATIQQLDTLWQVTQ